MSKTYRREQETTGRSRHADGRRSRQQNQETLRRSERRSRRHNDDFQIPEHALRTIFGF